MAVIKAGTYKFNAVPNKTIVRLENVSYTVWTDCVNPIKVAMTGNGVISYNVSNDPAILAISSNTDAVHYESRQGWVLTDEDASIISSQISTTGAYIEFPSDVTASNDFYTWFTANTVQQLSLHDQAEQCITDAYTAIGNKSGTIPTQKNLANLAGAIGTISTGVDTSDGNIEPTTVLKGYKGYAKGVAVNGAIETYDGTVEDVVIARYDFTYAFRDVHSVGNAGAYWYDGDNESAVKSTLSVSYGSPVVPVGVSAQSNKVLLTFLGSPDVEIRNISVAGMTYQDVTNTEVVDNPTTIIGSSKEAKILLTLENNTAATGNIGSISADIDFDY